MGRKKSKETIIRDFKKALRGYSNGQDINVYEKYIYIILFYRYLSEKIVDYIKTNYSKNYIELKNDEAEAYRKQIQSDYDYFILPEDLFQNIVNKELESTRIDATLNSIFSNIKKSSKYFICDIFKNIDTESESIGIHQALRSRIYSNILRATANIEFDFEKSDYDLFGFIFEFLLGIKDNNHKMSLNNGIYYTQSCMAKLLTEISKLYVSNPSNVYDPTCGSGSLLIEYSKYNSAPTFYGQELYETPAILCIMNMILHKIKEYHITQGDTLTTFSKNESENEKEKYELILANPPFGINWNPDAISEEDDRFRDKPIPPSQFADYAFIYHIIYTLSQNGLALVIDTPSMLKRGNKKEKEVKKHLLESNVIDTIILLPKQIFLRTKTGTCLFLIRKNKKDDKVLFIDASQIHTTINNKRTLSDTNIKRIVDLIINRTNIDNLSHLATIDEIANNNYSLCINDYINYNKEKTFTIIDDVCISDFIYKNEEENNYNLRLKYNNEVTRANKLISTILNILKEDNKVKMVPLENVAHIQSGSKLSDLDIETHENFPYRYITTKEIQDGVVLEDNAIMLGNKNKNINSDRVRKEDLDRFIKLKKIEQGDVLFGLWSKGTKAAIIYNPNFIFCDSVFCLKPHKNIEDEVTPIYLRYILESDYFVEQINNIIVRTSEVGYVKIEDFRKLSIPVIPIGAQEAICTLLVHLEADYKRLELALEREMEVYKNRYYKNISKLFNDITE